MKETRGASWVSTHLRLAALFSNRLKTEVPNWIDWDNHFFISDGHLISDLFLTDGPIFLLSIPRR